MQGRWHQPAGKLCPSIHFINYNFESPEVTSFEESTAKMKRGSSERISCHVILFADITKGMVQNTAALESFSEFALLATATFVFVNKFKAIKIL